MDALTTLQQKGYDPQTKDTGMGWICNIESNGQVRAFHGVTEAGAIERAAEYVAGMEERFLEQQQRLSCEGCGEWS